jgi:optic atrophy 3 protein
MRLRLGLLNDAAAIEKQAAREAAEAAAKKHKHSIPIVKTEAVTLAEEKASKNKARGVEPTKPLAKPRIRPLSEAKAIETGATFISEAFLFGVAGSLIIFEAWRSRRREATRREDVADRLAELEESEQAARRALVELEREVLSLRGKDGRNKGKPVKRILSREIWQEQEEGVDRDVVNQGWFSWITTAFSPRRDSVGNEDTIAEAGPAEKILAASDAALAAKHQQASEQVSIASVVESTEKGSE